MSPHTRHILVVVIGEGKLVVPVDFAIRVLTP